MSSNPEDWLQDRGLIGVNYGAPQAETDNQAQVLTQANDGVPDDYAARLRALELAMLIPSGVLGIPDGSPALRIAQLFHTFLMGRETNQEKALTDE